MFVKDGIIFILSKFGNLPWFDAPYHVSLSKNLTNLREIHDKEGYGCQIYLIDNRFGEIKSMRLVGFSTPFSQKLKSNVEKQIEDKSKFNKNDYSSKLFNIMMSYTTEQMVKLSEVNCRIGK